MASGICPPHLVYKGRNPNAGRSTQDYCKPTPRSWGAILQNSEALPPSSTAWHPKYSMASRVQHGIPITRLGVTTQQSQIAGVYSVAVLPLSTARLCKFPWPTIYGAASPPPRDCRPMKKSYLDRDENEVQLDVGRPCSAPRIPPSPLSWPSYYN